MRNVFLDTNILIDVMAERKPDIFLFHQAEENNIKLYNSYHSIATTHRLLKKHLNAQPLRQSLW